MNETDDPNPGVSGSEDQSASASNAEDRTGGVNGSTDRSTGASSAEDRTGGVNRVEDRRIGMGEAGERKPGARGVLAKRYRRLLSLYPADYLTSRGDEILDTYLSAAAPGRRRPSIGDVADVLRASGRQRLRANRSGTGATAAGGRVVSGIALFAAVALACAWMVGEELRPFPRLTWTHPFGPFPTVGAIAWLGWIGVGLAFVVSPARLTRPAILVALALTAATAPLSALLDLDRPLLMVLVAQLVLGAVALVWPIRPGRAVRGLLVVVGVGTALASRLPEDFDYRMLGPDLLSAGGVCVLLAWAVVSAAELGRIGVRLDNPAPADRAACSECGRPLRRPVLSGDLPVLAVLLIPAAFLLINPLTTWVTGQQQGPPEATWSALVAVSGALAGLSVLGVVLVGWRRRRQHTATVRLR